MMIGKRLTSCLIVAVLVVSIAGAGAVTTGVLAAEETDGNDSRETATEMAANSTETGTLESDDVDWYAFDVEKGERIFVHLSLGSDSTVDENTSARFDIFGPSGEKVNEYPSDGMGPGYAPNPGAPSEAMGGNVANQSGTYYVRVKGTNISEYDLEVETQRLDQYDLNEQPATATQIESGETIAAVLSGPDRDTYAIDLEKGETVTVTSDHLGPDNIYPRTHLLGPNASDATLSDYVDDSEYIVEHGYEASGSFNYTANESGTHFIRVVPFEEGIGSYDMEDPYELSVTVTGADGDDRSSDKDGSETDDGTADDNDSTGNDSTVAPDTDRTEQSDSGGSVDDADDGAGTGTQAGENESTSQSGPGFTGGGAVVGLLVTALLALRRR